MNSEVLKQILNEFERRRDRALHEQKMRQEKVYLKVPEIKEIDAQISKTGFLIAKAVLNNPENYMEYIEKIQKDMEQLKMKKAVLLTENNITLEYLDVNFQCNVCKDTGYLPDGQMCNCLKQELINKAYKMSNLENEIGRAHV